MMPIRIGPNGDEDGFGLYIHWPFCLSKCPYCDFNSHVSSSIDQNRWRGALIREMTNLAPKVRSNSLVSIFFGGGTPSLMEPETIAGILDAVRDIWAPRLDIEITMEANPTSVEAGQLSNFRDAGINRISLGVQALNEDALEFLGRGHDAKEAIGAIETAHNYFERVSFDLIYARPEQTIADWTKELVLALDLAGEHLSLYQLTIEPGTAFHTIHKRGGFSIPDDDAGAMLYEVTNEILSEAGLPAYEISNHAKLGAECQHNLIYWRTKEYLGIGPGAHGRLVTPDGNRSATRTHRAPAIWLDRVEQNGHAITEETQITSNEHFVEMLMMGLRLREGVPLVRLEAVAGGSIETMFDPSTLNDLTKARYLEINDDTIRATDSGRQCLNAVLQALFSSRL